MSQIVLPSSIDAGTEMVASEVQNNFTAIRDIVNGQLEGGGTNLLRHSIEAQDLEVNLNFYNATKHMLQQGVMGSGDGAVTPVSARDVSVASGFAWIIDSGNLINGAGSAALIPVFFNTTVLSVPANASGNPRLDQIIATISDYGNATLSVLQGTPTAAADLTTRNGAAAIPSSALRIADLVTTNGFAGPYVNGTSLRDRRAWARGMRWWQSSTTSNITVAPTTMPGTTLFSGGAVRLENNVVDVVVEGNVVVQTDATPRVAFLGVAVDGVTPTGQVRQNVPASSEATLHLMVPMAVATGSHTYNVQAALGGTSIVERNVNTPLVFRIYEDLNGQSGNANNT